MSVYIDSEKENMVSKKLCRSCMAMKDHKYIETYEKVIENYRPHSGKRLLTPREAKETKECWQCQECGCYSNYNEQVTYKERKGRINK